MGVTFYFFVTSITFFPVNLKKTDSVTSIVHAIMIRLWVLDSITFHYYTNNVLAASDL